MRKPINASPDGYLFRTVAASALAVGLVAAALGNPVVGVMAGAGVLGFLSALFWFWRPGETERGMSPHLGRPAPARGAFVPSPPPMVTSSRTVAAPLFLVAPVSDTEVAAPRPAWSPTRPMSTNLPAPVRKPPRARPRDVETNTAVV